MKASKIKECLLDQASPDWLDQHMDLFPSDDAADRAASAPEEDDFLFWLADHQDQAALCFSPF